MEIAVFSSIARTLRPGTRDLDVERAFELVRELGFGTVQLGRLPDEYYGAAGAAKLTEALRRHGLRACALTMVYEGESYADPESVRRTVGFMPEERLEERVRHSLRCVDTAAKAGVPLVTTHVGLIPTDHADAAYARVVGALERVAAHAATRGVGLALETGQESAEELIELIDRIPHRIGVNFDGANFVCYRTDDSVAALERLYPRVLGVHVKDYLPPEGDRFLRPCRLGAGAARVDETLTYLERMGYPGPLILEVYDEHDPAGTIAAARDYLEARGHTRVRG